MTVGIRNFSILFFGAMMLTGMCGCAGVGQRAALPGSFLQPPQSTVPPSERYELVRLITAEGTSVVAQFGAALDSTGNPISNSAHRPTVLFFYGNRMCIAGSQGIFEDLRKMGVNVMIPEYPGYGMNDGSPTEQGCYAAADAAYAYLRGRSDVDPELIVPAGLSIGGGVAVDLASRMPVAALVLVVPFTRTRDVGKDNLDWYFRWATPIVTKHVAFDNLAKIRRITRPILIVEALRDQLIPSQRSEQLASAAPTKVTRVKVASDHDGAWNMSRMQIKEWLDKTFPLQMAAGEVPHVMEATAAMAGILHRPTH
jgi:esterase/lipase